MLLETNSSTFCAQELPQAHQTLMLQLSSLAGPGDLAGSLAPWLKRDTNGLLNGSPQKTARSSNDKILELQRALAYILDFRDYRSPTCRTEGVMVGRPCSK